MTINVFKRNVEQRTRIQMRLNAKGTVFTARGENLDGIGKLLQVPRTGTLDLTYRRRLVSECEDRGNNPNVGNWELRIAATACGVSKELSFDTTREEIVRIIKRWHEADATMDEMDDSYDPADDPMDDESWESYDEIVEPPQPETYEDNYDYEDFDAGMDTDRLPQCKVCCESYHNCGCEEFSP